MGEGVDPTQMCQTLVNKIAQSKALMAIADSDLLVLFEDWLEELEEEVIAAVKAHRLQDPEKLADSLGLSRRGATFLISKLTREGKLSFDED